MNKNYLHSIEIDKETWNGLFWGLMILGVIIFSVFNSTFFIPTEYTQSVWLASIGLGLIGFGFGLIFARMFKIKGIDTKEVKK
jgi:hypothetical protein